MGELSIYLINVFSAKTIKISLSIIIGIVSFLFGEINISIIACGVLYITDMFLGFTINAYRGTFSWDKLRRGIFKFILYGGAIIVGHMLDLIFVHTTPEFGARYVIIIYLGVTEGLSVLKHFASIGLHIPSKLINRLEGIRDDLNSSGQEHITIAPITTILQKE